jgi:hypothetical protein
VASSRTTFINSINSGSLGDSRLPPKKASPRPIALSESMGISLAALARPSTSPLLFRFSADRNHHNRSTGTCAVPCRRKVAPKSKMPRNSGKSVGLPVPRPKSAANLEARPCQRKFAGENTFFGLSCSDTEHCCNHDRTVTPWNFSLRDDEGCGDCEQYTDADCDHDQRNFA